MTGLIHTAPLARHAEQVVLFDVASALEECTPYLLLLEVHVFPKGPAWVLDVEWTGTGEEQDGILEAHSGVVGDVGLEEGEGTCC